MKLDRLFEIIYILMNKKTVTAKELAEHFGVSGRTIYRDIDVLSLAGIPVFTEKGRGGGISILPDFVLNKFILNEQEQSEILLALQGLSNIRTSETGRVLQKLSVIFNKNTVNWMEVDFSDWSCSSENMFHDFKTAILERRVAEFEYYSTYGEKTQRRIEPVQLWFKSKAWYIKGFCLTRNDMRLFKLTRVKGLVVTDEQFSERSPSDCCPDASAPPRHGSWVDFTLRISPEMSYRVYDEFEEDEVEKLADGSFLVSVIWTDDDRIYRTILSFGEHIEVLEPAYVREIIKEKAMKIANKYS